MEQRANVRRFYDDYGQKEWDQTGISTLPIYGTGTAISDLGTK